MTVEELVAWRKRLSDSERQARHDACQKSGHTRAQTTETNTPQTYCPMCLTLLREDPSGWKH